MFGTLKERFVLSIINSSLAGYEAKELDAGKRLISVVAGVYILQKGLRSIRKQPFTAVEEVVLGSILLFNAASGLNNKIVKKPKKISDIRKNQIQGNDPKSGVPAFV